MQTLGSLILNSVLEHEKINANKLADLIGISRTQPLYDILKGKVKKISPNYAKKILDVFPHYSYIWLTEGKEPMLQSNENTINTLNDTDMEIKDILVRTLVKRIGELEQENTDLKEKLGIRKADALSGT